MAKVLEITELISVFCSKYGHGFNHEKKNTCKKVGFWGGAALGAKAGAGVGLVGGPVGAIAGTVPGAVLGALFGKRLGGFVAGDDPKYPKCKTSFRLP